MMKRNDKKLGRCHFGLFVNQVDDIACQEQRKISGISFNNAVGLILINMILFVNNVRKKNKKEEEKIMLFSDKFSKNFLT
jgi:hypothetical protein